VQGVQAFWGVRWACVCVCVCVCARARASIPAIGKSPERAMGQKGIRKMGCDENTREPLLNIPVFLFRRWLQVALNSAASA
jgi:hypothetical protein